MKELVRRVFGRIDGVLQEEDLFGSRFTGRSVPSDLSIYLGQNRCGLAFVPGYLDPVALSYLTGYARWFFAPSFMLRALEKGKVAGDSEQFVNVFRFCSDILQANGLDEGLDLADVPSRVFEALNVERAVVDMSVEACLPLNDNATHPSSFEYFCRSACHFSACERKVVAMFLRWMLDKNPFEIGASLALECFWKD